MSKSVRFRADPSIIRVGIRKNKDNTYTATVSYTQKHLANQALKRKPSINFYTQATANSAEDAVMRALQKAKNSAPPFEGIDLEMEWAYDHPQKV